MAVSEKVEEKCLSRVKELISKGKVVASTQRSNPPRVYAPIRVDITLFSEWKVSCLNLLSQLPLIKNPYYSEFFGKVSNNTLSETNYGLGIITGLKEDIEKGSLQDSVSFIQTEIFSDFLAMAEHIFEQGHKDPPVMLAGAVLEDSLRKICIKNKISFPADSNIASLNHLLLQKEAYNKIIFKQVDTWKAIRDYADHADFDKYTRDQIKDFLSGIRKFIGEYLG